VTDSRSRASVRCLTGLVVFLAVVVGSAYAYEEEVTVGVGEQKIVGVPVGSDITFTGPLHIKRLDAGNVKIIGDSPGWGSVTVRNGSDITQYSVTVVSIPPEQTIGKLKALLGALPITYSVGGGQVILEGRIESSKDLVRFNRVMEMFPGVVNMVAVAATEPLIDIAVTMVEVDVTTGSGLGLLDISTPTGSATMGGSVPLGEINGQSLKDNLTVNLALSSKILSALNAQIEDGRAKVVANPRIVTQNLKQAQIASGGQIPYRVVSATGTQGVEYKPYGITLDVTPEERDKDILLHLSLESSEPVGTVTGGSENPLTSRSIDLSIAVEKDRTLVIAGLYNAVTARETRTGCLFPLFATSTSTRKREIVVLVTPRVSLDGIQQDFFKVVAPGDMRR
jgi:Flp pilus assembly secretin CpaC